MNKKDIGLQLKNFRKRAGYTQAQLAELVNIHEKQISRIESGLHFPTFDNFIKLMNALDVEMKDFSSYSNNLKNKENIKRSITKIINKASEKDLEIYLRVIQDIINYKQKLLSKSSI